MPFTSCRKIYYYLHEKSCNFVDTAIIFQDPCVMYVAFWNFIINIIYIHTLRVHYAHAAANLDSGYSKYAKVARLHYFCTICTPNISRSADASVSAA